MTTEKSFSKKIYDLILASKEFWYCAIVGIIITDLIQSLTAFFWGGRYFDTFLTHAPILLILTITLRLFRPYYFKWQCRQLHPINLMPVLCLVAIGFSSVVTIFKYNVSFHETDNLIFFFKHIFTSPNSIPYFASEVGFFGAYFYIVLSWLMVYVLIQAERSKIVIHPLTTKGIITGTASLLIAHEFVLILCIIAFENTSINRFSFNFIYDQFWQIISGVLLSTYGFLIKPKDMLFGSRILPLLPLITVLVFCSSILCMWALKLTAYLHNVPANRLLTEIFYFITNPLGGHFPLWENAGQFAGILRQKFNEQFILILLFLYLSFSRVWQQKSSDAYKILDVRKSLQFWIYNLSGWITAGIYFYLSDFLEIEQAGNSLLKIYIVSFIVFGSILGTMLRSIMKQFQIIRSSVLAFTYQTIILSFIFGILLACSLTVISYIYIYAALGYDTLVSKQQIFSGGYYFYKTLPWFSLCFVVWSLIYEISVSQRNKLLSELKQLQLEKNMKEIQLNALAGKVDPHFIFNALNNIRALVRVDGEKARDAIIILSDILRSPIAKSSKDKITIAEELILVRNYIALSTIQLGNRLDYQESVDDGCELSLIPSMMLQILVENAIKHGISQQLKGGILSLCIRHVDNNILCRITNTGELSEKSAARGFGIGVKSIRERLSLLYSGQASFKLEEEQGLVIAELILPLEHLA